MWRLCGKLWTRAVKWTLKREELLSSRIEFNRQRIVLYSFSLFLASFVIHALLSAKRCTVIVLLSLLLFATISTEYAPSSRHFIYTLSNYSSCALDAFSFLAPCFSDQKKNVDSRDKYLFSRE